MTMIALPTPEPRAEPGVSRAESRRILTNVQGLRAAAAMLVVVHHLKTMAPAIGLTSHAFAFTALGVDLFFVISGFIMVLTTNVATTSGMRFLKNRVARVVPLYWVMTLLVFVLAFGVPDTLGHTQPGLLDLLRSLAFIPYARADGAMWPVLFLGWSLNYEMFFYVVFAAAVTVRRRTRDRIDHVALAVAAIAVMVLAGFVVPAAPSTIYAFYTNPKMIEFAVGMLIARGLPRLPGARLPAVAGIVVGFAWLAATPWLFVDAASTFSATAAAGLILLSALSAERGGLIARWTPLVLLGDASYSLYLVHPFVTQAATKMWQRLGGVATGPVFTVALALGALVLAAIVAVAAYRLLETPLSRVARRWLDTRRPAISARGL